MSEQEIDLTTKGKRSLEELSLDDVSNAPVDPNPKAVIAAQARVPHPSPDIPDAAIDKGVGSPKFLTSLVKWHPALGFFQYLADCMSPASMPPDERFNALAEKHKGLWWTCFIVDFISLIVTLLGLAAIAGLVVYKTVLL